MHIYIFNKTTNRLKKGRNNMDYIVIIVLIALIVINWKKGMDCIDRIGGKDE